MDFAIIGVAVAIGIFGVIMIVAAVTAYLMREEE
jgi:hypothetical protein